MNDETILKYLGTEPAANSINSTLEHEARDPTKAARCIGNNATSLGAPQSQTFTGTEAPHLEEKPSSHGNFDLGKILENILNSDRELAGDTLPSTITGAARESSLVPEASPRSSDPTNAARCVASRKRKKEGEEEDEEDLCWEIQRNKGLEKMVKELETLITLKGSEIHGFIDM